jgi:hypothetical protein
MEPGRPFISCGTNFVGPFYIRPGWRWTKTRMKCCVVVFICLATWTLHLKIISDNTSQAFPAVLRFISHQGEFAHIYSDNRTTFMGTDKELYKLYAFFKSEEWQWLVADYVSCEGICWQLIPRWAPHFGGIWEASVKSFKYYLRREMGVVFPTFEELIALVTQIEAYLNSIDLQSFSSIILLTHLHWLQVIFLSGSL